MDIGALGDTVSLARKSKLNKSLAKPSTHPPPISASLATLTTVRSKIGPKGMINASNTGKLNTTGTFTSSSSSSSLNTIVSIYISLFFFIYTNFIYRTACTLYMDFLPLLTSYFSMFL
jgi:hypothetical protein